MRSWNLTLLLSTVCFISPLGAYWNPNSALMVNHGSQGTWFIPTTIKAVHDFGFITISASDPNSDTYFFCPKANSGSDRIERFCLSGNKVKKNKMLPVQLMTLCGRSVEPFISKAIRQKQPTQIICTADGTGFLYGFYYVLCEANDPNTKAIKKFITMYEFCYKPLTNELLYVNFDHLAPDISKNDFLAAEQSVTFPFNTNTYEVDNFNSNHFTVMGTVYQHNPNYKAQFVGSPEFRGFALTKKPFFHYVNTKPMAIDISLRWESQLRDLNDHIQREEKKVNLYFGTLHEHIRINNDNGYELSVPRVWWVVVYDRNITKGTAVIMDIDTKKDKLCQSICDKVNLGMIIMYVSEAKFYCCPASVISKNFTEMPNVGENLYNIGKITVMKRLKSIKIGSSRKSGSELAELPPDDEQF